MLVRLLAIDWFCIVYQFCTSSHFVGMCVAINASVLLPPSFAVLEFGFCIPDGS